MWNHAEIGWWIAFLFLSLFFSGIESAYIAAGKLQYIVNSRSPRPYSYMLDIIYSRFRRFLATLMVGRIILLVFFVYFTALIVYHYSNDTLHYDWMKILLIIAAATPLLLLTNEYLPRILFGKNPDLWVKLFLLPAFLFYILLYPVAGLFVAFSQAILRLSGVNLSGSVQDDVFYRVDFDAVIEKKTGNISK
uniref:DUF21 domain-containing protein n=1 Tax=uncultured Proteiniphilum sp. TaxID=497637 RepID=UPI0026211087